MKCLLDTHFLIWITSGNKRLRQFPWLQRYQPWGVSPASFLEIQLLSEIGKIRLGSKFMETLRSDSRFVIDEASYVAIALKSLELSWTRDPFDRLIAGHSLARRSPLCSMDSIILENHRLLVPELRRS
jgi:PIN domain nuclease of toxin-antitoxin system